MGAREEWAHDPLIKQAMADAPAGWYPNPSGAPGKRYWDGNAWCDLQPTVLRAPDVPSLLPGRIVIGSFIAIVILGLGAACIAGARNGPVHSPIPPGASSDDVAFLRAMDEHGITNEKGPQAEIDTAHEICGLLGQGYTVDGLAKHYSVTSKSDMSDDDMHYFIETAAATYCPQHVR
jgi:hypothetical protein